MSRSVSEYLGVRDGVSRSLSRSGMKCLGVCLGVTWSVTLVSMERCGASGATLDPDLAVVVLFVVLRYIVSSANALKQPTYLS